MMRKIQVATVCTLFAVLVWGCATLKKGAVQTKADVVVPITNKPTSQPFNADANQNAGHNAYQAFLNFSGSNWPVVILSIAVVYLVIGHRRNATGLRQLKGPKQNAPTNEPPISP